MGLRPAAQHHGHPGHAPGRHGCLGGLFNTHFFVDRTTEICASIYTNSLPFVTEGPWTTYQNFEQALYASRR